jgi:hypothetical protein
MRRVDGAGKNKMVSVNLLRVISRIYNVKFQAILLYPNFISNLGHGSKSSFEKEVL